MNAEAKQASYVIDSVARAVANWTVDQHAEINPQLASRYGSTWRSDWRGHTESQVHMLAQAAAVRSSDVFGHSVRWSFESFKTRGLEQSDLRQNLKCMQEVLTAELPSPVAKTAAAFVEASIQSLGSPIRGLDWDALEAGHRERALRYLQAVLEGDRATAESMMLATLAEGIPIAEIYEKILAPVQERLGWMWHRGEISVADEHFGSATTQAVLSQFRPHFQRSAAIGRTVVATSTPGDLHEIGLRMVADLFEIDGWNVVFLGANTPIVDIIELLSRRQSSVLAVSVSTVLTLRDAGELIEAVRQSATVANTKVLIGGPPLKAVPDLWRELGADGCALSATDAVRLADRLVAG